MARRRDRRPSSLLRALKPPRRRSGPASPASPWSLRPPLSVPRLPPVPRPRRSSGTPGRWLHDQRTPGLGGRSFDVYLPAGLRRRSRVPMLLLLHGCTQTPAEFADATRFTTVADRHGVILVLPRQESRHHTRRCWRWYESLHQLRGSGEPALLAAITRQVAAEESRWRVDPLRVYVAGLSAGGAMALIMAAVYPDLFAAAGVHSAPAYRSATHGGRALPAMAARTAVPPPAPGAPAMVPLLVVQGTADEVVAPLNGDRVADQWLAFRAAATGGPGDPPPVSRTRTDRGRTADGRRYTRVRWYTARRQRVLEYWLVQQLGHAWSGGRPGGSYSDPTGPRAATLMWSFFRSHRLDRSLVTEADRATG
jgi:poly(hydroxyalkanoate) depolymerase family esterase